MGGVGGAVGEEIGDEEGAIPPRLGKLETSFDGGVVVMGIGGCGIEADEEEAGRVWLPDAP